LASTTSTWPRATRIAEQFGAKGFDDYQAFLDACDAVVIAVPATWHEPLARQAIEAHRHVLCEKPLALTGKAARFLADEAAAHGRILQVGHQERFVAKAMGVLAIEEEADSAGIGPRWSTCAGQSRGRCISHLGSDDP
jgi:predicted dehydrogenase